MKMAAVLVVVICAASLLFVSSFISPLKIVISKSICCSGIERNNNNNNNINMNRFNNIKSLYSENEPKESFEIITSTSPSVQPSQPRLRSQEWANRRGMEPGYGGLWPGDPNAPTYKVTIRSNKTKQEFVAQVPRDRYIYYHFEEEGFDLPVINKPRMCRQGCCTICAAKVIEGKTKMDSPLGLLKEMREKGYVLSCCTYPRSDMIIELQTEDEMYIKQWGEGFEGGGVEWGGVLPDDD